MADAEALAQVHESAWRYAYAGVISGLTLERIVAGRGNGWWTRAIGRSNNILVVDHDTTIAGYATLGPSRMRGLNYRGEIYEIYLKPEYHGIGFGHRLFQAARNNLRSQGLSSHAVRVLTENTPACRFYESQGGRKVAESQDPIGPDRLPISIYGWPGN